MTSYYFAGRYSMNPKLQKYRNELHSAIPTSVVTSRWIDCHPDIVGGLERSFNSEELEADPSGCWEFGQHDIEDLESAATVVSFTGEGGKGGRHVEFGYAIATGKRLVIIGRRENIFHCHPNVEQFSSWEEFLNFEIKRSG